MKIRSYKNEDYSAVKEIVSEGGNYYESMDSFENYKLIFPCDEEGNLVFEPSENKKISYCEKIK